MQKERNPWQWLPTLYFVEGLPYTIVMTVAVIMYKNLNISNAEIALYTSWLYLPWVIKPIWSPVVDVVRTKKWWIYMMQLVIGGAFAAVAFTLPMDNFFQYSLAAFWIVALTSATNDIATDGFYMIGLRDDQQAFFVGIRSTFYRLAMWVGQGGIVYLTGHFYKTYQNYTTIWSTTFLVLGACMAGFSLLHKFILPNTETLRSEKEQQRGLKEVAIIISQICIIGLGGFLINKFMNIDTTWTYLVLGILVIIYTYFDLKKKAKTQPQILNSPILTFFNKKGIKLSISFILLYRLGEAQLVKIATPFLLDDREVGGIGLTNEDFGILYGTIGLACLVIGGILGGIAIYRKGLKFWVLPMVLSINLPNLGYWLLASFTPEGLLFPGIVIAIEQFFYGFGFTALMMYMLYISQGENKTAHYAVCTGLMAFGMMVPGMPSGYIQEFLGYSNFFLWVVISGIPAIGFCLKLKIDPKFGLNQK
ncbi:MFS transporter [Flammeovirga aprica]|uniref:AmpG family muropeptide MFS transporter n=1 Tax=Flammeovirga aprica JL-4 TaxID=694437 RepID=A0A7X9RXV2_9BACT|nr:MFS transporter [Flammeovirga aprica]NME70703.1 AmpG family muropeptide MFS transporter [Flammeovirga aprica JL-4]